VKLKAVLNYALLMAALALGGDMSQTWAGDVNDPGGHAFVPWDALIDDPNMGPGWLKSDLWANYIYTVNGDAYQLAFGLARSDGGPRGMNSLKFSVGAESIGHHETENQEGYFDILNTGDTNTYEDLLLLVSIDAQSLPHNFGLGIATDCNNITGGLSTCDSAYRFDPIVDFTFHDPNALGYDTGRPSGLYWKTTPSSETLSYLFDKGMVTVYGLKQVNLGPNGASVRVYYDFDNLNTSAAFSVYGSVSKKDKTTGEFLVTVYHTNRTVANPDNPTEEVSTFAVIPPFHPADLDENRKVDLHDLVWLRQFLGQTCADDNADECTRADLDGNGRVNLQDVGVFIELITELLEPNSPNAD
jgi:hypothetical protein